MLWSFVLMDEFILLRMVGNSVQCKLVTGTYLPNWAQTFFICNTCSHRTRNAVGCEAKIYRYVSRVFVRLSGRRDLATVSIQTRLIVREIVWPVTCYKRDVHRVWIDMVSVYTTSLGVHEFCVLRRHCVYVLGIDIGTNTWKFMCSINWSIL
jgi:hypothetical protein